MSLLPYNFGLLVALDEEFEPMNFDGILTQISGSVVSEIVYGLAAVVLVSMLVWAGFTRLTAADSPQKVKQANATIMWAIVGFIIIMVAQIIMNLIAELVPGWNWSGPTVVLE